MPHKYMKQVFSYGDHGYAVDYHVQACNTTGKVPELAGDILRYNSKDFEQIGQMSDLDEFVVPSVNLDVCGSGRVMNTHELYLLNKHKPCVSMLRVSAGFANHKKVAFFEYFTKRLQEAFGNGNPKVFICLNCSINSLMSLNFTDCCSVPYCLTMIKARNRVIVGGFEPGSGIGGLRWYSGKVPEDFLGHNAKSNVQYLATSCVPKHLLSRLDCMPHVKKLPRSPLSGDFELRTGGMALEFYRYCEANTIPVLMLIAIVNVSPAHTEHARTLAWTLGNLLNMQSLPPNKNDWRVPPLLEESYGDGNLESIFNKILWRMTEFKSLAECSDLPLQLLVLPCQSSGMIGQLCTELLCFNSIDGGTPLAHVTDLQPLLLPVVGVRPFDTGKDNALSTCAELISLSPDVATFQFRSNVIRHKQSQFLESIAGFVRNMITGSSKLLVCLTSATTSVLSHPHNIDSNKTYYTSSSHVPADVVSRLKQCLCLQHTDSLQEKPELLLRTGGMAGDLLQFCESNGVAVMVFVQYSAPSPINIQAAVTMARNVTTALSCLTQQKPSDQVQIEKPAYWQLVSEVCDCQA